MIPAAEQIEVPLGDNGQVFLAAVAVQWKSMMLKAPSGAGWIGFALSPQPMEAVIAKLTPDQARAIAHDLLNRANALERDGKSSILMPNKGSSLIIPGRG